MPRMPRIRRALPSEDAFVPLEPIPVTARMIWHDGATSEVTATARAWTSHEVEVEWTPPWGGEPRCDWIRADQVQRRQP